MQPRFLIVAAVTGWLAQAEPGGAQRAIPIQQLGAPEARSAIAMGNVYQIHARSDGRVLVNDGLQKRLLLFDSTLATFVVLADNSGSAPASYGPQGLELVLYNGDSTLVLDGNSLSFSVYDVSGKVTRTIAAPKPSDITAIVGYGNARLDSHGRLIYRAFPPPAPPPTPGASQVIQQPDSGKLVRGDFDTRLVDTVGTIAVPTFQAHLIPNKTGGYTRVAITNPLPKYDVWTVTSDGSLAIVRSQDYHVDWVRADGTRESTPKMPFDWRPLTDSDKTAIIDSVRTAMETAARARLAKLPPGSPQTMPTIEMVPPKELPDYMPPFKQGSIRADREGNIWLPPTTSLDTQAGQLLYNVVNARGEIARRVQVPLGHFLVGFGPNGALYLTVNDSSGTYLERARVK